MSVLASFAGGRGEEGGGLGFGTGIEKPKVGDTERSTRMIACCGD